jgi:hypothetical protein
MQMRYHIRIKGHLDESWQQWFAPLQIRLEPSGTTVLSGALPDQAALYGVLLKLDRLGLTLLWLEGDEVGHDAPDSPDQAEHGHHCE